MEWILAIVLGALAALVRTWLKGFLNPLSPSPARARLFLRNIATPKPKLSDDRFQLVLCWLANDYSGHDTDTVERAFHAVPGVTLLRSSGIVKASGAADDWRPAMLKRARAVLNHWNADLAIGGLVKKPGDVLSLCGSFLAKVKARSHSQGRRRVQEARRGGRPVASRGVVFVAPDELAAAA